jgi:uncharacterized protein YdeI (YjbR/CyaY-like superfamily)
MHTRLASVPNRYTDRLEGAYIERTALRRFEPGRRFLTIECETPLRWKVHETSWLIERWVLREKGVALVGPDPKTLIDPISPEELRDGVRRRLREWATWAADPHDPEWLPPRSYQAYVVETMCRALYALASGELISKAKATTWAASALPGPWQGLVERCVEARADATPDEASIAEVLGFVQWAAGEGEAWLPSIPRVNRYHVKPKFFESPAAFREWLERNHDSAEELSVGFHKKNSRKPSITYQEALDGALCYGWIDGVRRNPNEDSYTIRFTPRKPKSVWSAVNIRRAHELIAEGRMTPPGLAAFEKRDEARARQYSYERENVVFDAASEERLRHNKKAWEFFRAQPQGYQRLHTWWVVSAKKEETRAKRLAVLMEASAEGRRLDPMNSPYRQASGSRVEANKHNS